jgi:hypothetical protein
MGLIHVTVTLKGLGRVNGACESEFLVDTGATDSMAPAAELRRAGIEPVGTTAYELADGTLHEYAFGLAQISFMGEITAGRVIFGPDDVEPLGCNGAGIRGHHHRPRQSYPQAPPGHPTEVDYA